MNGYEQASQSVENRFNDTVKEVVTRYRKETGYHWMITDYYSELYGLSISPRARREPTKPTWWRKVIALIGLGFASYHRRKSDEAVAKWCNEYMYDRSNPNLPGDLN